MTTTPLRPDIAQRATLGRWLYLQSNTIAPPWIAAVRSRRAYTEHQVSPAIDDAAFYNLYRSLTVALETGRYAALDDSISFITRAGRVHDYQLNDLLSIVAILKNEIWQAVIATFPPAEALGYLRSVDVLFQTVLSYQARVFTELTQKELADELSRAQQELERLDRTKSRFIRIAAHELRTPLTLIQGYSDMLGRELAGIADEQIQSVLTGLSIGTRRLLTTVNDMIDVSLIDAQALTLKYQIVSLPHIIQIILNDLQANLRERELYFKLGPVPPALPSFYADPKRLYQVLDHVISNGVKYTPDGGAITIGMYLLEAPEDVEQFVEVRVADTGIGISADDLPHLFEKFYSKTDIARHSSSRTKFKGGGSGLGLSVVKGIVEAHGGQIIIESPGYDEEKLPGTTVRILLPARDRPPSTAELRLDIVDA